MDFALKRNHGKIKFGTQKISLAGNFERRPVYYIIEDTENRIAEFGHCTL